MIYLKFGTLEHEPSEMIVKNYISWRKGLFITYNVVFNANFTLCFH